MNTLLLLFLSFLQVGTPKQHESPIIVDGVKVIWDAKQNHYLEESTGGRVMFFEFTDRSGKTIRRGLGRERKLSETEQLEMFLWTQFGKLPRKVNVKPLDRQALVILEAYSKDRWYKIRVFYDKHDQDDKEPWEWDVYKWNGYYYKLKGFGSEDSIKTLIARVKIEASHRHPAVRQYPIRKR